MALRTPAHNFSLAQERVGVTSKRRQCSCRTCRTVYCRATAPSSNLRAAISPLLHVALRIIVGIASVWSFVMAVTWYRATKEMQRTGNARRLPFTFPADFMWLDLMLMARTV